MIKKFYANFQMLLSLSMIIAFSGMYLSARTESFVWIILGFFASVGVSAIAHVRLVRSENEYDAANFYAILISCFAYALASLAFLIRFLRKLSYFFSAYALIFALIFTALALLEALYYKKYHRPSEKTDIKKFIPIGVLCLLIFVLNIETFSAWIRWDSYDYYYYMSDLSFESFSSFDSLRLANHATYLPSLIYIVFNEISGAPDLVIYLVNILMIILGTFMFYRILQKLFPKWNTLTHLLFSAVYAFSPFTLGLVWTINLEAFLAFGIIMFFWGETERLPFIQTFASLLICFSKETGVFILFAIMVARLSVNIFRRSNRQKAFLERLELDISVPALCCGLIWLVDYFAKNWLGSNNLQIETVKDSTFNSISLNPIYIKDRLISLLFTNFTWLILIAVILGFVVGLILRSSKKEKISDERVLFTVEALCGMAAFLVPLFLFVTYNHIRYGSIFVLFLILLLPEAIARIPKIKISIRSIAACAIVLCSLAQCYFTADPLMHLMFRKLNKGTGAIVTMDNNTLVDGNTSSSISVSSQYNREIMYFDKALDKLLANMDCDSDTVFIFSPEFSSPSIGGKVYTEYLVLGFGYPFMPKPRYIAFDNESGRRYLADSKEQGLDLRFIYNKDELAHIASVNDNCVYISFPFRSEPFEDDLLSLVEKENIAQSDMYGWEMTAYRVTAKTKASD